MEVRKLARIAVEEGLSQVRQALREQGHDITNLNEDTLKQCDCCVISGMDQNMMGMEDALTKAPVISADGLSAGEVARKVREKLNL